MKRRFEKSPRRAATGIGIAALVGAGLLATYESSPNPNTDRAPRTTCNSVSLKYLGHRAVEVLAHFTTRGGAEVARVDYLFGPAQPVAEKPGVPAVYKYPGKGPEHSSVTAVLQVGGIGGGSLTPVTGDRPNDNTCSAPINIPGQ